MKRTFIAVPVKLSDKFRDFLQQIKNDLKDESIKWVGINNMHITLAFFGSTSPKQMRIIHESLLQVVKQNKSFELWLKGLGVFPSVRKPRVLWVGIEKYEELSKIRNDLWTSLINKGIIEQEKKEFVPHLTIARLKWIENHQKLGRCLEGSKDSIFLETIVDNLFYFQSNLTPAGPIYEILGKYPLIT